MKLFHVQDSDRPMFVVAESFQDAVDRWEALVREENHTPPNEKIEPPSGIAFICDENDLLIGTSKPAGQSETAVCDVCKYSLTYSTNDPEALKDWKILPDKKNNVVFHRCPRCANRHMVLDA